MTRKEAVANLNMISAAFVKPVTKEQRKLIDDTFSMAISALEQLPSYERTINKLTKSISEEDNTYLITMSARGTGRSYFYKQLQKEKIKEALTNLSNWCHMFRYDCTGCPLLDHEGEYDICSLKYYNRFGFDAKSAIDRIERRDKRQS